MSLPQVSQAQIEAMQKEAEKKMAQDGIVVEEVATKELESMHPTLQHHQEPENNEDEYEEYEEELVEKSEPIPLQTVPENESGKSYNMRMLRERAERAEREREELMKHLLAQQQTKKQPVEEIEVEEDDLASLGIDSDSLAEGKHLQVLMKEIKSLRKEVTQSRQQSQRDTTEVKLKSHYPDFDKVCTHENLVKLRDLNPDLADVILSNKDQFKQAKLAYEMVKQMGIYREDKFEADRAIAIKNSSKPRPLAAVSPQQGESPMSKANAFANGKPSDEMMRQYWKETQEAIKNQ